MELTPEKPSAAEPASFLFAEDNGATQQPEQRPKKPPPITPRRFEKFFTPRPRNARHAVRTSRAALQDITGPALNRRKLEARNELDLPSISENPVSKKRKLSFTSHVSSLQSSPIKGPQLLSSSQEQPDTNSIYHGDAAEEDVELDHGKICNEETDIEDSHKIYAKPVIRPYWTMSTSTSLLSSRISGRRAIREVDHSQVWLHNTANFYSSPKDAYLSSDTATSSLVIPFSTASCHTNSLVAVGNEDGNVELVDSAAADKVGFSRTFLTMKPHQNAIMDLEFSSDDALLATASGDQTSQIIDMQTQTSIYCLSSHSSSVKRIQFQPGSGNNVIATCSRDGCINFWDLRCRTVDRPSFHLRSSGRAEGDTMNTSVRYVSLTNSIREAHTVSTSKSRKLDPRSRSNPVTGRNDFSVTSLSFLGPSRPNMIVTASELDAIVKLWDMRTTYSNRRGRPVSLSSTREPISHQVHRRFGLTSLAFSGDGARLYTLCRDHTVYVYATSHLVLGDAPEMSTHSSRIFRASETTEQGLGPLYGFRHPRLRISTFYPKLAVRKSNDKDTELLAVGSTDDCAILFPTNERYLTKTTQILSPCSSMQPDSASLSRPNMTRQDSTFTSVSRENEYDLKLYSHGTPLIRGHGKEVTAVTWTSEGSLVTASDDCSSRCWREDASKAREMRTGGEGEGRRWGAGWADVDAGFDDGD
jgi:WD40 repeat protein